VSYTRLYSLCRFWAEVHAKARVKVKERARTKVEIKKQVKAKTRLRKPAVNAEMKTSVKRNAL
jgi:hypothetical protein